MKTTCRACKGTGLVPKPGGVVLDGKGKRIHGVRKCACGVKP